MFDAGEGVGDQGDFPVKPQADQPGGEIPLIVEAGLEIAGLGGVAGLRGGEGGVLEDADEDVFLPGPYKIADRRLKGEVHPLVAAEEMAV